MGLMRWGLAAILCGGWSAAQAAADGPIEGFGADLPLPVVLRQILPSGISVVFEHGVDQDLTASWRGGASWQAALREAIVPLGLSAQFEDARVVVASVPAPAVVPMWLRPDHWVAEPGEDLAQVARLWGARVGITPVIHGIYRYPIEAHLSFDTDFQDAISRLVESFSTAEPRPLLDIWSDGDNYTVEITQGAAP